MEAYFRSRVVRRGDEAQGMVDGGVLILFSEPVPDELADVSVIHAPDGEPRAGIGVGDLLRVGDSTMTLTAVGERAEENLRSIGHLVVYADPDPETGLLPGAVHAHGTLSMPDPDAVIELRHGPGEPAEATT